MCIQNKLQQHILDITNDGKDVIEFFYATMHGQNPHATFHHQMEAARELRKLGLTDCITVRPEPVEGNDQERQNTYSTLVEEHRDGGESSVCPEPIEGNDQEHENTPSPSMGEGWDGGEESPPSMSAPVTDFDIINYEVARLIRKETNDGYFIAEFLSRVMRGTSARLMGVIDKKQVVSEADRMAAAKELMNRGLGKFGDSRSRRSSVAQDDQELIQSGLARYIRERTDYGMEAARFMLDVASGEAEKFSMHQRVVATREIMRRAWDTNYDAVTSDDIVAYYERQDAREPTKYDIALQKWFEEERAARNEPREEEPQPEPGLFAHLPEAEITRYESMSDKEREDFREKQRQHQASRPSAASAIPAPSSVMPARSPVVPAPSPVIPAQAGIQKPHTSDDLAASTHTEIAPETGESEAGEPSQDVENTDRSAIPQDAGAPIRTPHPTHPVTSKSLTHIRSP